MKRKPAKPQKRPKSDATFWRDGTTTNEHPYWGPAQAWWWKKAGWKKDGAAALCVLLAWGYVQHPAGTEWLLACTLSPAAGVYAVVCFRRLQGFRHYWTKVKPLAFALAAVLDQPVSAPRSWLHVPVNYAADPEAEVVIDVPGDFTGADRDMEDVTRAVAAKLAFPNPQVTPRLGGRAPCLVYRHQHPPPEGVSLADIRPRIDAVKPSVVVLGLAAKNEPVELDLDSEIPHVGVSMSTGLGKSEISKNMAAQLLFHGAIVMILDYKLVSHMWADGLPNVCYARTPAEIHEALMWLAWDEVDSDGNVIKPSELTRRKEVLLAARRNREKARFTRLFILAEERNATARVIRRHWRRMGGRGSPPALEALDETGETGRGVDVNIEYVAQRLSAKAAGSDGSRDAMENIGAIITKDPSEQTWKLLGGGHAQPPKSGHPGRYQLIRSSGVTEYQGVLYDRDPELSDAMARELAMAGTVGEPRWDMPFVNRGGLLVPAGAGQGPFARQEGSDQAFVVGQSHGSLPPGEGPARAVTLAEIVAAGLVVSIGAARKLPKRHGWRRVVDDPVHGHQYALTDVYKTLKSKGKR